MNRKMVGMSDLSKRLLREISKDFGPSIPGVSISNKPKKKNRVFLYNP